MQVELEEVSPVLTKMKVVIPADIVQEESQKIVKAYTKKAKIPGFRPGKAPVSIIERHYGKEIQDELLERVIPHHCFGALRERGVVPIDTPRIEGVDYEKGEALSFTALIERRPEFELKPYEGIKAKKGAVVVTDEDVEMTLESMQEKMAEYEEAPEGYTIAKGDYVLVNCIASIDGVFIDGSEIKGYPVKAGRPTFPDGLGDKLVGARKGDMMVVPGKLSPRITGIENDERECTYQVNVADVSKVILPKLDDAFVKSVSKEENLDALKAKIREDICKGKERDLDLNVKYQVMKQICDMYSFEVPPTLVDRELLRMIQRDLPYRDWKEEPLTEAEFEAYAKAKGTEARESVRGRMVLEEIAKKENIRISDAEIDNELKSISASSGESMDAVRTYYINKYGSLEAFAGILALDKTMDFLMTKAVIEQEA